MFFRHFSSTFTDWKFLTNPKLCRKYTTGKQARTSEYVENGLTLIVKKTKYMVVKKPKCQMWRRKTGEGRDIWLSGYTRQLFRRLICRNQNSHWKSLCIFYENQEAAMQQHSEFRTWKLWCYRWNRCLELQHRVQPEIRSFLDAALQYDTENTMYSICDHHRCSEENGEGCGCFCFQANKTYTNFRFHVHKRLPKLTPTRWNYIGRFVNHKLNCSIT